MSTSSTPAISVAATRPSSPSVATMPATMVAKAAVGPEICTREPAEEGDQESCDNCGVEPLLGTDARCDRQRDGERQRHDGDYDARHDVAGKLLFELFFGGMLDDAEQDRFDFVALQGCLIPPRCFSFCCTRCPPGCFCAPPYRIALFSPGRFCAHGSIPYWGQKNSTQAIPGGI